MLNSNLIDRIKLPFRKDKELFSALYNIMGFYPRKIEYYKLALLHKSISKKNEKGRPLNNERLEFLGDAILDAVAGDIVYKHFEGKREGFLTITRSKMVSREMLGKLAEETGLKQLILTSRTPNTHNSYMGGNAFEALVGAIYLDRGYRACKKFFEKRILKHFINIDKVAYKEINYKSKLLEWSQKNKVKLEYKQISFNREKGGSPVFEYQILIEGLETTIGKGYTKKESHQKAAKEALLKLKHEPDFVDSIFKAKENRTKMEEEPAMAVPNIEEEAKKEATPLPSPNEIETEQQQSSPLGEELEKGFDEFDLSDISATPKELSDEEIIAAAEAEAFNNA